MHLWMVFHLGRFWTGALPLDPGTNWRPTSWVEYLGCSRRVGEVKTKKHPSRLVVGRHVCGFAQDPLRVSAFLSYRTVCQLVRCKGTTFPRTNKLFKRFFILNMVFCLLNTSKMPFLSPLSAFLLQNTELIHKGPEKRNLTHF